MHCETLTLLQAENRLRLGGVPDDAPFAEKFNVVIVREPFKEAKAMYKVYGEEGLAITHSTKSGPVSPASL